MKVAFAEYEPANDTFEFTKTWETVGGAVKTESVIFTGDQLSALRDKKMNLLTEDELSVGLLYLKYYEEEPGDLTDCSLEF